MESKNNRKRAEADLQLLSNRIALLRLEEQKSLQKVQETKKRAQEILEIKKRNENSVQQRIMLNVNKEMEVKEVHEKAIRERDARRAKLAVTREQLVESKRQVARQLRSEQKLHEESAGSVKAAAEQRNHQKAQEEKKRREAMQQRKEEEKRKREMEIREAQMRKIRAEEEKRRETEKVIAQLEEEERSLIERLKKTQAMQEKAIESLQQSLEA